MKRVLTVLAFLFLSISLLAAAGYSISIDNADGISMSDGTVVLVGSVRLSMSTGGETHILEAESVVVDPENHRMTASGNVRLSDETGSRSFNGDSISMDWETLNVLVMGGVSTMDRNSVSFYATGESISYSGDGNVAFFNDGVIATSAEDPAWSITAGSLAFAGSDFFITDATLRIGRVPVLWLPFFFYPGSTIILNPAMGISSSKGSYLNLTYEVYGTYSPTTASNSSKSDTASTILAFLDSGGARGEVKDGFIYRTLEEGESLSERESWAKENDSYLAVFADVYEKAGLVIGALTKNNFGQFKFSADALVAYDGSFRYLLDVDAQYEVDKTKFSFSMPVMSDSKVSSDYLNRNSAFSLDSVLGRWQNFPTTYSTSDSYEWSLSASTSAILGDYSFRLDSMKASVEWKLKDGSFSIKQSSLPYVKVSSSGEILDIKIKAGDKQSSSKDAISEPVETTDPVIEYISVPAATASKTRLLGAGDGKLLVKYEVSEVLDNIFGEEMVLSSIKSDSDASVTVQLDVPKNIFSISGITKAAVDYGFDDVKDSRTTDFKVSEVLSASLPFLGIDYKLTLNLFDLGVSEKVSTGESTETRQEFAWDDKGVTQNSLSVSKSIAGFTLKLTAAMNPVKQSITPSVTYSKGSFYGDFSFKFGESDKADLSLKYTGTNVAAEIAVSDDISRGWLGGVSGDQKLTVSGIFGRLNAEETFRFGSSFLPQELTLGLSDKESGSSVGMSFYGASFEPSVLDVQLKGKTDPIYFYKGRAGICFDGELDYSQDFGNPYATSLGLSLSIDFSLYEFLDLSIGFSSRNSSFIRYYDDGRFSFRAFGEDLLRSFDIFGDGIYNTGFNIDTFSIELVHYMSDWNLYVNADGKVSTSGGKSEFKTELSIYVKWKALQDLKAGGDWNSSDKEWK